MKHQSAVLPPPPPPRVPLSLPPLTSVQVVLRAAAARPGAYLSALPHAAAAAISSFLDCGIPKLWSLPRVCEANLVSLLPRLVDQGISIGVDPFYWRYQCSQGLVFAVKNANLEMVEWLHAHCPNVLPYAAMTEAAKAGNVWLLGWLSKYHASAPFLLQMADAAASNDQVEVLQWLRDHPQNGELNIAKVFGSAVQRGFMNTVKWFHEYFGDLAKASHQDICQAIQGNHTEAIKYLFDHPEHSRAPIVEAIDLGIDKGDLGLVQWLFFISQAPISAFSANPIDRAASSGYLHIVQWLHIHQFDGAVESTEFVMDRAAGIGSLNVVKWIREDRAEGCSSEAMDKAAESGHLEVVQWLHANRAEGCTIRAMNSAAQNGHLEVVQWLHTNRTEGCTWSAIDGATVHGHLEVIKWLHANRSEGCSTEAIDLAAFRGHLETVQWLHENRKEGCTARAMDRAALNGHLDIVKYLHENRAEGCTSDAMDNAAWNGYLDVVKYLHENRSEGCTVDAMNNAAAFGHLEVVKWLHETRTEGCTTYAMDNAAANGHLDVVQWLHENRNEGCTPDAMELAANSGHFEILLFLHAHRRDGIRRNALCEVDPSVHDFEMVQWLHANYAGAVNIDLAIALDGSMAAVLEHILGLTSRG